MRASLYITNEDVLSFGSNVLAAGPFVEERRLYCASINISHDKMPYKKTLPDNIISKLFVLKSEKKPQLHKYISNRDALKFNFDKLFELFC